MMDRIFEKIFNISEDSLNEKQSRLTIMLNSLIFTGILILTILCIVAFIQGYTFLSIIDFIQASFLFALYIYIKQTGKFRLGSRLSLAVFLVFFLTLFATGAANHQAFVWFYVYPLISLFLLGTGEGAIYSLILISLSMIIHISGNLLSFYTPYPEGLIPRLLISYLYVLQIAYIYEKTRKTTQKRLQTAIKEMNELAIRDGLTGLYNRRYMDDVIPLLFRELAVSTKKAAFVMADLDLFKSYNDTYGHNKGDEALKAFGAMMVSTIRRQTDYVFRYGGEEFSVLLLPTNYEKAEDLARMILNETEKLAIPHTGSPFGHLTISVGVALVDITAETKLQQVIEQADAALYEAKDAGRNRYVIRG